VVLTGVQLSSYGKDIHPSSDLVGLVHTILMETDVPRLRLSSLEPWNLPKNFFRLWEDPRICRQLHLPLQSGAAGTLRRMARPITPERYARLIQIAREHIPGLAVTTDVIVGFPGETQSEFHESLDFIQSLEFSDGHVFKYSAREGTSAVRLPRHVSQKVMKERSQQVHRVIAASAERYRHRFSGSILEALWESATQLDRKGWEIKGTTDNYLKVRSVVPRKLWNTLTPVKVLESTESPLCVEVIVENPDTIS
jgi:threonylcarbamoyladenosine tRNA methylthiotransferase MtaB